MAPIPLEGVGMPVGAAPHEGSRGGSMPLGMLIDLIVQRTYHELTVLAELLPRKTDMERKIEIYNYSARTRQLFVRLLALVKWANSASKVDKSAQIMAFLDKQSLLFVDTADMLARMARDTLVHARLPNFHIPAAVEVLTTGTYSRLPVCIRDRIVPPDPITTIERRTTLDRLNRVIQHRLVTGRLLPQMRNLRIDAGRVTFTVDHEFQVSLTVMGDGPNIPWRLLDIDILVDDKETGEGKPLVHQLQVQYVHQVVQMRLADNPVPLSEVYYTLHFFCQCLQLEVLYSQTLRLCRDRLDDLIMVDDYTPGKCLTVSYWKELASKDPKSELGFWLTVQVDQSDPARPLAVVHVPTLSGKEIELADRAIRSDLLSMERLLVHTIFLRTKRRLAELKEELESLVGGVECSLQGSPVILSVPVLMPCLRAEHLLITVDTHTGMLQCHVPQYDPPMLQELQAALNTDRSKVAGVLSELRFWMTMRRCEKTLQHLPATAHDRLPLLHLPDHPMTRIGRHRVYVRLHRHPNAILIAELRDRPPHDVDIQFYMAAVKQASIEDNPEDDSIETEIPKMYLKVMTLVELDSFVLLHGPFTPIEEARAGVKRKGMPVRGEPSNRRSRQPAYFLAELAHAVALCDERIPFVTLAQELTKRDIAHQGLQVEANATAMVLRVLQLPQPGPKVSASSWSALLKRLLSVSIRAHGKGSGRCWVAELVFHGSPLQSQAPREAGSRRPVYCQYDMGSSDNLSKTVDALLADWAQIVHLHDVAHQLSEHFAQNKQNISQLVVVKSYTYSRLVLGYGPEKGATVTVQWCEERKAFTLVFGAVGQTKNAHGLLREQFEAHLNRHRDLPFIIHLLHETYKPMLSISKLPTTPQMGVHNNRPQVPVQTFSLMPQSHSLIRLVYQGMYCLELRLKGNGVITIRDGAYSRFDRSNVVDELTPTQGLKGFLGKYVEETAALRRRSQCEDDDPPSPVAMDTDSGGGSGTSGAGSSFLNPRGPHSPAGLKFHAPVTPPSGSNPHTPSSPHTGLSQPHSQTYGSPAFSLASPPSLPPPPNPSPSMLPHASPGGFLASSPGNPMHVPSPAGLLPIASPGPVPPGHSPGYLQAHLDGSPFPASQSPAVSNWPGSPSLPRPSPARPGQSPSATHPNRVLPQRSWAGAVPTQLTHEALDVLCTPAPHPSGLPGPDMSPLERFLGCVYMRRALQRFIQAGDCLTGMPSTEPLVVLFKVETLQCRVALNSSHLQSLHLKATPLPEHKDQWSADDLLLIEKLFDTRAAAPPYKPNALCGFGRLLNVPIAVLKDFVQIIKLELVPGLVQQQGFKWAVQWCLRIPPSATPFVPVGQAGVISCRNKLLFFLQLTRVGVQYLPGMEPPSLVLPLVYDTTTNVTQLAEKRDPGPSSGIAAAAMQLKQFNQHTGECSLFPSVRDLLANLTLPSEPPQMMSSPAHTGSVTPTMQPSPAMMHSPMSVSNVMAQPGPMSQQGPGSYPGMGMSQHMMGPN